VPLCAERLPYDEHDRQKQNHKRHTYEQPVGSFPASLLAAVEFSTGGAGGSAILVGVDAPKVIVACILEALRGRRLLVRHWLLDVWECAVRGRGDNLERVAASSGSVPRSRLRNLTAQPYQ